MRSLILILALTTSVLATAPTILETDGDPCHIIFEQSSLISANFSHRIAHGIHSLTVDDIKKYFNPAATENNTIPVINKNLSSNVPILNNAPKKNLTTVFKTQGLQVAEEVLLHIGESDWDLGNSGVLGKMVHALHMHEMWYEASIIYNQILKNPPTDPELCPCLTDVEANGIYFHLRQIAMLIREPELAYNTENKRIPRRGRSYSSGTYSVGTYNGKQKPRPEQTRQKREAEEDLVYDVVIDDFFRTKSYWVEVLEGFRNDMTNLHSEVALYIYCIFQ